MPRSTFKMERWDSGLSTDSDPRDILDTELVSAKDISVNKIGKIILMGSSAAITSPPWDSLISQTYTTTKRTVSGVFRGYGLDIFSSDYTISSGTTKNFLVLSGKSVSAGGADAHYVSRIWSSTGVLYGSSILINSNTDQTNSPTGAIALSPTATYAFLPNTYYADGGLRICDGNFTNTSSTNKWFGYIKRTHFGTLTAGSATDVTSAYAAYYDKTNNLSAPTVGVYGANLDGACSATATNVLLSAAVATAFSGMNTELDKGTYYAVNETESTAVLITNRVNNQTLTTAAVTDWDSDEYLIMPAAGLGFNLQVQGTGTNGSWIAGTYQFASTFMYDDEQESKLFELSGAGLSITATSRMDVRILATITYDPRISGGRIYTRISNSGNNWALLVDIDLDQGVKQSLQDSYSTWQTVQIASPIYFVWNQTLLNILDSSGDTYESLTGIEDQSKDITAKYKTAVITNNMAYIGNVRINGKNFEDSIFKSFVNRYDTFIEKRRLTVARDDGEAVVKLLTFADRIIELKNNTVYIINIAGEVEFLEDTYRNIGIDYPFQAVHTEYGAVWINEKGCYLYNGKGYIDLLLDRRNQTRRKIDLSTWTSFLGTYPAVSYDAKNKKLLVFADLSSNGIDIYQYDLITGSWTPGVDKYDNASANYANPISDWDGDIILYNDNSDEIYQWSDTSANSSNMEIITKDLDFGHPGIKKNLYKVIITYTSDGSTSNVQVQYDTNGGTSYGYDFTVPELPSVSGWGIATLIPDTISEAHNFYSCSLKFSTDGTVPSGFKINDIYYILRIKGKR